MTEKMALPPQQFCVRWNSYHTNLQTVFPRLLLTEQFSDVTLACESRQLRCHKLVLSACSAYLERLLVQNPCKHPIVFMKDMRFSEMQALVDFMYKGEVNVTQDELPSLLRSAEALQIRGLCSGDTGALPEQAAPAGGGGGGATEPRDYALATEALLAQARPPAAATAPAALNGAAGVPPQAGGKSNGSSASPHKKRKSSSERGPDVKEETVEEDGLYYGELDNDNMEYNEDEDSGKPGSSLGQASEYAIANVQCQYESGSECEDVVSGVTPLGDHNYDRCDEPPAFIIQQVNVAQVQQCPTVTQQGSPFGPVQPKIMTIGPGYLPSLNVIHVADSLPPPQEPPLENKRIRRSEQLLTQAADCVSQGLTFQTVSERFKIPISTIRFFMARKGILPRRRRGRHVHTTRPSSSPEPPYHMQHYRLPEMLALKADDEDAANST